MRICLAPLKIATPLPHHNIAMAWKWASGPLGHGGNDFKHSDTN